MKTPTREVQLLMDETSKQELAEEVLKLRECSLHYIKDGKVRMIGECGGPELNLSPATLNQMNRFIIELKKGLKSMNNQDSTKDIGVVISTNGSTS